MTFRKRQRLLPATVLAAQPRLLLLTAFLMFGLAQALAAFNGQPLAAEPKLAIASEIDLQPAPPSPNLNPSEPKPEVSAPPPEQETQPEEPEVVRLPVVEPELVAPPEPPRPIPEPVVEPVVAVQPHDHGPPLYIQQHRGDSPMIKNWKLLGMQAVLAGAMLASAQAGPIENPPVEPNKDDVIAKQLAQLTKAINELKGLVVKIEKKGLEDDLKIAKIQGDIGKLTKEVEELKLQVDKLASQSTQVAKSKYGPNGKNGKDAGRVIIVNTYGQQMVVVVNGRAYTVAPDDIRYTEPIPVGAFNYEVLGVQARRDRRIDANELFTIKIHPRTN